MNLKNNQLELLLSSFIEKDIPFFISLVTDFSEESLISLPGHIKNIKARLDQILAELSDANREQFIVQRNTIKTNLEQFIPELEAKLAQFHSTSKIQLENLAKGARLLGSYRIGPERTSSFLDSSG